MQTSGLHHVTSIAGDPQANLDFYVRVLGLRLVKITVNYDAPDVYHLYYGNGNAEPGSMLTFFPWPGARGFRPGVGQTYATAFAVPPGSLDFWTSHLNQQGVEYQQEERFGERILRLTDHDTTRLELVEDEAAGAVTFDWTSPFVPAEPAIRGFYGVTLWESDREPTAALLTDTFGLEESDQAGDRTRYQAPGDSLGRVVDIVAKPATPPATGGAGSVHHIAWRTPDDETQLKWRETLLDQGLNVTPVRDRQYFHSIYFREPGGVLFEIATDEPGFTLDESMDELGSGLRLPPWLEDQRERITAGLTPLVQPTPEED